MRIPSSVTVAKPNAPKPSKPGAPVRNPSEDNGFLNLGPLNRPRGPAKKPAAPAPTAPKTPNGLGNGFDPTRPNIAFIPTGGPTITTAAPGTPPAPLALAPAPAGHTGPRPTQAPGPRSGAGWAAAAALVSQG